MKSYNVKILILFCIITHLTLGQRYNETRGKVKELIENFNIKFGVSTSAVQFEGAWNESGETMWSHFTHVHPEKIADHSTVDISADSYHNLERDINMLKFVGLQFYRFSISWSRLLPTPILHDGVNQEALQYYHNLIDQLIANNITPIVTLAHQDLPIGVSDLGGWTNAIIIDYFEHFARIIFDNFADKVKVWITINQPDLTCAYHYEKNIFPPDMMNTTGVETYLCLRNLFLAHARVYHLYKEKYDVANTGQIGFLSRMEWFEPMSNSTEDLEFITTFRKLLNGVFCDPIFSEHGDYPEILKETVANKSKEQGFHTSRLKLFTKDEIEYIRNTSDFFGFNYYTPIKIVKKSTENRDLIAKSNIKVPSFFDDINYYFGPADPNWVPTEFTRVHDYPEGFRKSLVYVKNTYNNPKIFIMENGCGTMRNTLDNYDCVKYFQGHLNALYDAVVKDGCNVQAYGIWSLLDGFEWADGYTIRFGLFHTNFTDERRSTQPKATAHFFKEVLEGLNVSKDPFIISEEVQSSSSKLESYILNLLLIILVLIKF